MRPPFHGKVSGRPSHAVAEEVGGGSRIDVFPESLYRLEDAIAGDDAMRIFLIIGCLSIAG